MALTLFKLLSQAILTLTVLQTKFTKSLLLSQFCSVPQTEQNEGNWMVVICFIHSFLSEKWFYYRLFQAGCNFN